MLKLSVHAVVSGNDIQSEAYTRVQMSWLKLKDIDPQRPQKQQVKAKAKPKLKEIGLGKVGGLFYQKFFALEPDAKQLFPLSMRWRYKDWDTDEEEDPEDPTHSPALKNLWAKFISVVGSAVAGIQDGVRLVPMLQELGVRHAGYGLQASYFHLAGKILVDVIAEGLGDSFTKEVENAWVMVSSFMVATMLSGYNSALRDIQATEEQVRLHLQEASDAESTALGETEVGTEIDCRQITLEDDDVLQSEQMPFMPMS